jgi:hypothetical protein
MLIKFVKLAAFSYLVPPSAITANNTGGGVHFDATPAVFDIDV